MSDIDFGNMSMYELFRVEAESQLNVLQQGLLDSESREKNGEILETMMRAAHSLKGAARMVGVEPVVQISHVMEDCLVTVQKGELQLTESLVDALLFAVDMIGSIAKLEEADISAWQASNAELVTNTVNSIVNSSKNTSIEVSQNEPDEKAEEAEYQEVNSFTPQKAGSTKQSDDRYLRVSNEQMSKIMGTSSELLVETRWYKEFSDSLLLLKRRQNELAGYLDKVRYIDTGERISNHNELMVSALRKLDECRLLTGIQLSSLEEYDRRTQNLVSKLYRDVSGSRMQPFVEGIPGLRRMVRDLAKKLGKKVDFIINGADTLVDKDVLEKITAPLTHIVRNALDHGIEDPVTRQANGKNETARLVLSARHSGGMLRISVRDDGSGISLEKLKDKIVARGLSTAEMVAALTERELVEFVFLPGFSTRDQVTETSGRGVGLDVVQDIVKQLGGSVTIENQPDAGTKFILLLPLSLSVLSALVINVEGETYALPLTRVDRLITITPENIQELDGKQYVHLNGRNVGIVSGAQLLGCEGNVARSEACPAVVVSDRTDQYCVVVNKLIGQRQLSLQSLDKRLGKIRDVSAVALLEDGSPVVVLDVDDIVRSIDHIINGGRLDSVSLGLENVAPVPNKRILVVDDSLTVREVVRGLLETHGYAVETAVDGVDGWNAVRSSDYDLIISDVDMPRMTGIELVHAIKHDLHLSGKPVMIVSYKDRKEDRQKGLEAGADYYLAKGSFHDDTLIDAVVDLIGEA